MSKQWGIASPAHVHMCMQRVRLASTMRVCLCLYNACVPASLIVYVINQAVADTKLGGVIKEKLGISIATGETVYELFRGIRTQVCV